MSYQNAGFVKRTILIAVLSTLATASPAAEPAATKKSNTPKEGKKYVIIHADDAGMSHSVNQGTIEAMDKGIVSSASIMVPCPWFSEFAAYARKNPEKDFGIHLTLTSEWDHYRWGPVTSRDKVPSLVDKDGYLWDNVRQVAASAKASEVEIELRAQIDRAMKFGVPLSHLDTHMGSVLARPDLTEVYINLGLEYDLPILFIRNMPAIVARQYPGLAGKTKKTVAMLDSRKLPVLDAVFQYYSGNNYDKRKEVYLRTLRSLRPGVTEIIIHCGIDNAELKGITGSHFIRDTDRRVFTDPQVIAEVKKLGIEVITWKKFRKMVSDKPANKSPKAK